MFLHCCPENKFFSTIFLDSVYMCSVQFSCSVMYDSLRPHEQQHAKPPCPSPTPAVYSNSRPLSWWCHPTISSSVVPFSSCLQSFPASGSFQMSHLFTSGGQSIGVSASTSVLRWYTDTYIWNLERWHWWINFQGSNGETDIENRPMDMGSGEEEEGEMYGESNMETFNTICKIDSQWEFTVWLRELKQGLCNRVKGGGWGGSWEGGLGGRGHAYTYGWFLVMYDRKRQNSAKQLFLK